MANIGKKVWEAIQVLTGKKETVEHGVAHAAETVRRERTVSADDVDHLERIRGGRLSTATTTAAPSTPSLTHVSGSKWATIPEL